MTFVLRFSPADSIKLQAATEREREMWQNALVTCMHGKLLESDDELSDFSLSDGSDVEDLDFLDD